MITVVTEKITYENEYMFLKYYDGFAGISGFVGSYYTNARDG